MATNSRVQKTNPAQFAMPESSEGKSASAPDFKLAASSPASQLKAEPAVGNGPDIPRNHRNNSNIHYGATSQGQATVQGRGDSHAVATNDVVQGHLGDCYFEASLVSLAKNQPDLLQNNIDGPLSDGTYNIRLYKKNWRGQFNSVIYNVSPVFPTDGTVNGGAGASGTDPHASYNRGGDLDANGNREIWVSLYQKAFAMMEGGYDVMDGGYAEHALEALTGQEHSQSSFAGGLFSGASSATEARDTTLSALRTGGSVVASTYGEGHFNGLNATDKKFASDRQIVGGHAYSVLNGSASQVRLRNPWGGANAEQVIAWSDFIKYFRRIASRD